MFTNENLKLKSSWSNLEFEKTLDEIESKNINVDKFRTFLKNRDEERIKVKLNKTQLNSTEFEKRIIDLEDITKELHQLIDLHF